MMVREKCVLSTTSEGKVREYSGNSKGRSGNSKGILNSRIGYEPCYKC